MKVRKGQKSLRPLPRLLFRGAAAASCLAVLILASVAVSAQQSSPGAASDTTLQLFEAVMEKDLARVQAAVTEGADITSRNDWGLTATELAIDKGYFEIAHYLLSVRNFQQANADRRRSSPRRDLDYLQPSAPQAVEPPAGQDFAGQQILAAPQLGTRQDSAAPQPPTRQVMDAAPSLVAAPPPPAPPQPAELTAATAPRPRVIISRVGEKADSEPEAPPPAPSGQTAALPAKAAAPEDGSKDGPGVFNRVWSTLTDAFSFGGKDDATKTVPQPSAAAPQAAAKPPLPAETAKKTPDKPQPDTSPQPSQVTPPPNTPPEPTFTAEVAEQGPVSPEPGAAAPQAPRPEALAQAPGADSAAPAARSGRASTMASQAPSPPRRARPEEAAAEMDLLIRLRESPVAAAHGTGPDAGPKAAPEPASPIADAPRPEAPESAVAEATAPAPRPDQRQAASSPETGPPVPAEESQFITAKPGAPAEDALRPTPAAPESTQTASAPAERAPAAPAAARPVAEPAVPPEAEAAPEPNLLSRVWSTVTETLGLGEPGNTRPQQDAAAPPSADSEESREQPSASAASPPPPSRQARLDAAQPERPSQFEPPAALTPPVSPHLRGVVFTLGTSLKLGQSLGPAESARARCVVKNFWKAHFCLEAVDWPQSLSPIFEINTVLYKGNQVIARYDEGSATRFYALFPSESFADVAAHFEERFGPPTAAPKRVIAEFGAPRRANPTIQWTSADPASQDLNVLEIRAFDDASGVLPNFNLGVVELYRSGTAPIFGHLYTSDLMILRMRQSSPHKLSSAKKPSSGPAKR